MTLASLDSPHPSARCLCMFGTYNGFAYIAISFATAVASRLQGVCGFGEGFRRISVLRTTRPPWRFWRFCDCLDCGCRDSTVEVLLAPCPGDLNKAVRVSSVMFQCQRRYLFACNWCSWIWLLFGMGPPGFPKVLGISIFNAQPS